MRLPRVRLRTLMIAVAVAAVLLALVASRWNQPPAVDPFDAVEMIDPTPKPRQAGLPVPPDPPPPE